ncbi:menaquinone biosynthetic enzyme MqnA/MqnD family protein [Streptomyces mexicanus]|uniref:Chorismate dehydratase n=1 Tax=Streptomyces mexicanus TaxID=178566 RepID=A0A7X1I2S6_9ACTN|nr:menaquinone biosynthesis protein [Streptomyces mexicanus]MBC2867426.1 menaquinone biosynthesis protein [Streptomyces mexicanus]
MKTSESLVPRVGNISFLNCAPIRWGLGDSGALSDVDLVSAPPEQLATELLSGNLDISPISLARYLQHADDLCLLPGLAIGSDGPVRSCHIVSRGPLEGLGGRVVALSEASRSTALLARMLLEDAVGVRPRYRTLGQDVDAMLSTAQAAVVIGDDALRLGADVPSGLTVHDTGAMWRSWTNLPMVYAVWAVRREFAQARPDLVDEVQEALTDAVGRARSHPMEVAIAAARESRESRNGAVDVPVLLDYYQALDYSLGERQMAAIHEFAARAFARGEALTPVPARIPIHEGQT